MPLAIDYRPKTLNKVAGNEGIKKSLTALLKRPTKDIPRCFAFFGSSGCGKTTLARIVASMLGCESTDFYELNAASVRGIDTIRDIEKQIRFKPIHGKKRVWLLDECFTKGTKIQTPLGSINIEDIKSGDVVFSAFGTDVVNATFQNKVELERLVKISLSNGTVFFCSNQHEFYTNEGWIFAENLNSNHLLFPFNRTIIENINSQRKEKTHNEIKPDCKMSKLQEKVPKVRKEQKTESLLQQKMCGVVEICGNENRSGLSDLQKNIHTIENQQATETILQSNLCKQSAENPIRSYRRNKKKNITISHCISQNKTLCNCEKKTIGKNETKQSSKKPNCDRKVKNHQKNERYFKCVVGGTRGEWEVHATSDIISSGFGLGNGSCGFVRKETAGVSDKLQIGCRKSRIENRYRNKRTFTSHEEYYAKRCQEESKTGIVRVDRVEFYKQTSNRRAFDGVVGDIETSQGFITLYDFEVKNHPSYFANGVLVHNCHQYPSATQEALLKMFEECPEHVAFMICTTDPQKLKPALKGRCTTFEVKPLDDEEMGDFLYGVCEAEEVEVPEEVIEKIVSVSNGSPRNALQQLEKIIDLPEKEMLKSIQQIQEMESQVIDLCRLLLKKGVKWGEVCKVISTIEAEPEQIRYAVLGYCNSILLKGDNPRAFSIMCEFAEPTYNTGKNGITMAAYSVVTGG